MKCIYCKSGITEFNKSKEHVFPKAFGCPDNWVLDCVCRDCNNKFGRKLERYLASDSLEGMWRLRVLGSRSKKPIRQTRIKINIPKESKYGAFKGAMVFADFANVDRLLLPAQVGISSGNNEIEFFLAEDVEKEEIKRKIMSADPTRMAVLAQNEGEYSVLFEILRKMGVQFKPTKEGYFPIEAVDEDNKIIAEIHGLIDSIILRAIAKISFNYLAKIKGASYVLDSKFDEVRGYINEWTNSGSNIVKIEKKPILAWETLRRYFFEGHIFTVERLGNDLIGRVAILNTFTFHYVVKFGELSGIIWYPIKSGHAYSIKEGRIIKLFPPTFLTIFSRLKQITCLAK